MNSLQKTAKVAGIFILIIAFVAPFSMVYMPSVLVVPGNAVATAGNLISSSGLFPAAMAADAVVFLLEVVLTALLYSLLKPVSPTLSMAAALARLGMAVLQGLNLLNYFIVLWLLAGADAASLPAAQAQGLVLLFLNAHQSVVLIWGLFFGLHLLLSGYLVYKSGFLPKAIGALLVLASACYLIQSFGVILLPQYQAFFTQLGFLSIVEVAFPLWLLIKGLKNPSPAIAATA